jgi:hypothetical protein
MKLCSLIVFFAYNVFGEVMEKFHQNLIYVGRSVMSRFSRIQQPDQVSMAVTRKPQTAWSQIMKHRKAVRVTSRVDIWKFRSFRFA